jgi:large subunit ribosomal protein L14
MIQPRTMLKVADNSGAKILQCFHVLFGYRKRYAQLGDIIVGAVKVAEPRRLVKKHDVVRAVIVRQRKEYRRMDGSRIKFEDNAVVVLKDDKGTPKGTIFKGAIAKEATARWPGLAKIAKIVV